MRYELRVVETKTGKVVGRYVVPKGYKAKDLYLHSPSEGHHIEKHPVEDDSPRVVHKFTVTLEDLNPNEEKQAKQMSRFIHHEEPT